MALNQATIAQLAEHLENCQLQVRDTPKITDEHPGMDWDDAYAIQDAILQRKLARGARVVGLKAGLTSHAKMKQMGVESPVFGFLVLDVAPDFLRVPAHRVHEEAPRPQMLPGVVAFPLQTVACDVDRALALQVAHHAGDRQLRRNADKHVDVVG